MRELFTIGYERASLAEVIDALQEQRIELLIDVRELPNSRRAGFSRRQLEAGLSEAGLAYRHLKALGTPKAGRDAAKRGDTETMAQIFEAKLATPESQLALRDAGALAQEKRVCLLCLEHDHTHCHRAIVAHHMAPFGFRATHLTPRFHAV
ncbi:MAG: DUF488 domain-containing protein [Caulobacterales bacterium]